MDEIIRQFAEKTPVHLLDEYKRHIHSVCNNVFKSYFNMVFQFDPLAEWSHEDYFVTGSTAEGASLARLFSPDDKTSREAEFDVMISVLEWPDEESLTYVDNNNAFIHIPVSSQVVMRVRAWKEDAEQKLFCQKEDGMYLNSELMLTRFREFFAQQPDAFNNCSGRLSVANKRCEAGNAAMSLEADETIADEETPPCGSETASSATSFASREARITGNATEKCMRLAMESISCFEAFEITIAEMLSRLQKVQDEFMEMRSEEVLASVYVQASKALEWAMLCVDITDVIYDTLVSTAVPCLSFTLSTNARPQIEGLRKLTKQKLQLYVDQLAVSEDDVDDVLVAAAVLQLLSDIERTEIAPKRFLVVFQELAKQQLSIKEQLRYVEQNPQFDVIPEPLQQLSAIIKKLSYDFVPCLKLMFWPRVAAEWETRGRRWPHQSVIDGIVGKGAHLVAKEFCHEDIDWRLSFSVAEIDLATRWSPAQHFVYFVFKSLFYKFIKPLAVDDLADPQKNKKYLASYTAKTVMMWTSESVAQSWWTEDDAGECLTVLLLALQSAFQCRTLDHYFVSSVNLLQGVPDVLASRAVDTIESILADPAAVVAQLSSHFENVQIFFNAMPAQVEFQERLAGAANLFNASTYAEYRPTFARENDG